MRVVWRVLLAALVGTGVLSGAGLAQAHAAWIPSVANILPLAPSATPLYATGYIGSAALPEGGAKWGGLLGIEVEAWRYSALDATWTLVATTTAGDRGHWTFTVYDSADLKIRYVDPTGAHASAWSPGVGDISAAALVTPSTYSWWPEIRDTLTLLHPGALVGTVRSSWDDTLVASLTAKVWWPDDPYNWATVGSAVTSAAGSFAFSGMPPGDYKVTGWASGYDSGVLSWNGSDVIHVSPDETTTVALHISPTAWPHFGSVVATRDGAALANMTASILCYKSNEDTWAIVAEGPTDQWGKWHLSTPGSRPYLLHVTDPSGVYRDQWYPGVTAQSSATPVPADDTVVRLEVAHPARVSGRALAADMGQPLANIAVSLGPWHWDTGTKASTVTAGDGSYYFDGVIPGNYDVYFEDKSAVRRMTVATAAIGPDADVTGVDGVMDFNPRISGTVRDAVTGRPLAGVEVRVYTKAPELMLTRSAVTDANGAYTVYGLYDNYRIIVAFVDPTHVHRDQTWPYRGLPVEESYWLTQSWGLPVNAALIPMNVLKEGRIERVQGLNRYATAIEASRRDFPAASTAVLASGDNFPDALSASSLAGAVDGPILLTYPDHLPAGLVEELRRLHVEQLYLVGGPNAVRASVAGDLVRAGLPQPTRLGGKSRYETSALIAREVNRLNGSVLTPFVCRGDMFPDALSIAPFAYMERRPILLTDPHQLPPVTRQLWSEMAAGAQNTVYVIGSENAVSDDILWQLQSAIHGQLRYARIYGGNRYETNEAVIGAYDWKWDALALATGENFPDALSGGAGIGFVGGPLVLTRPASLSPPAQRVLSANGPYLCYVQVLGSSAAVSDQTMRAANSALGDTVYGVDGVQRLPAILSPLSLLPPVTLTSSRRPLSIQDAKLRLMKLTAVR